MGKLIVIEGVDSSGKQTQAEILHSRLLEKYKDAKKISFPDYESEFSVPVKRYLAGDLGSDANSVNAYAASTFYAIDRFASYKTKWGGFYEQGGIIVADRYVTSNIVHQASKLEDAQKPEFIEWLSDLEYNKMQLPVPDMVIFLDMPPRFAISLMKNRSNKITGEKIKDIHENNSQYLKRSYDNAISVATHCGWHIVSCVCNEKIRTIDEISAEIFDKVNKIIK